MTTEKSARNEEFAKLYDERKQARELCDELAEAAKVLLADIRNSNTWYQMGAALAKYEARPWRYSG